MKFPDDVILKELVRKKKSLLDELLVQSIRSVVEEGQEEETVKQRSTLLHMLQINDEAIRIREEQTGIEAKGQEQNLYSDIANLLLSIKDNNHAALLRIEALEREAEKEKSKLGKGKNLAKYVAQNKSTHRSRSRHANLTQNTVRSGPANHHI